MSRIGKKIIEIPQKVKVEIQGSALKATGPLGSLTYNLPEHISAVLKDGKMNLEITGGNPKIMNVLHGTTRANVYNVIQGVATGFSKNIEIQGLGYKAQVQGAKLNMELGFSHPVLMDIPPGLKVEVDPKQTLLTVKGMDKFLVGDFSARVRKIKPPEPYKGSGIRYQGEYVARKAGKSAATTSGGAKK